MVKAQVTVFIIVALALVFLSAVARLMWLAF
jgi:hypothetical protein